MWFDASIGYQKYIKQRINAQPLLNCTDVGNIYIYNFFKYFLMFLIFYINNKDTKTGVDQICTFKNVSFVVSGVGII